MKQRKATLVLQKHRRGQVARARVRKLREERKKREEEQRKKEEEDKKALREGEQEEENDDEEKKAKSTEASAAFNRGFIEIGTFKTTTDVLKIRVSPV